MSAWAYSRTGKQLVGWAGGIPASLPDKELQDLYDGSEDHVVKSLWSLGQNADSDVTGDLQAHS